jgi:hypothetical protein
MPYYYTIDQTGHDDGFAVCTPDNRQIAYLAYDGSKAEESAEEYARLIVAALNGHAVNSQLLEALTQIGKACRVQANLNSTASHEERSRFISSVFDAWNEIIVPMMVVLSA